MNKLVIFLLFSWLTLPLDAQDIQLSAPDKKGGKPLMQALSERKSAREFQEKELPDEVLSNLLWAANGFNREDKRTAPTANNRQELELYLVMKSGIYFYNAREHRLALVKKGDYRKSAGTQTYVANAPVNILFVSDSGKASGKNYAYTDCGFVSQNIYLFCASEGLATVVRGSYDKKVLEELLQLPANQEVLLTQTVGYPK
ncbi:MAG: SagB/ThcOx family dehydrogenase [Petrimonas sp.]|jgi:SagB-type dehydrogenase family enzyme|uniref:Nitroreductase domain-containing protein n=1 Tax=bioreactor metagenome TaxID=1076179 RepID=A0A644XY56_9ZZZZ|nr:SagB/ThcOx family dehydrogenase [Petrimonas sp.]NLU28708.1 SagB/ThcOx family dehydrogenase [Bacteroidales bacterium]BBD45648.1 SagB-type dehydrogenase domain-containing protein [Petrimonas sp. IBARAKI]HBC37351.1 nitroreductase [Porphyromonadaceae bacterium]MDD3541220.1 SagB/ThcOx family dehydrogenase [Petrimonas sp.]